MTSTAWRLIEESNRNSSFRAQQKNISLSSLIPTRSCPDISGVVLYRQDTLRWRVSKACGTRLLTLHRGVIVTLLPYQGKSSHHVRFAAQSQSLTQVGGCMGRPPAF